MLELLTPPRRAAIILGFILSWLAPLWPEGSRAAAGEAPPRARHLVVCVDGVGLSTIEKLRAEGRFERFGPPSRMVAPFPSLTNVAMTEVLRPAGVESSPGYEDAFFDRDANRARGGLLDRFRGDRFIAGTWRERFDYHPSALKSGLGYALPPLTTYAEALSDVVRMRQKAAKGLDGKEDVFFAYVGGTDSLAHLGGERMLGAVLRRLDGAIERLVRESDAPLRVSVFSDHGNHFRAYERVSLSRSLRRAGLRPAKRVDGPSDVVIPSYGLVGAVVLFTAEANEPRAARAVAAAEGVDFAAYERGGVVRVVSRDGLGTIERRGDRYRYLASKGDPLGLLPVLAGLADRADADGFVADADWFEATRALARPDAVRRVYDGVTGHVRNRANVVVSLEDGYLAGSAAMDMLAAMRATHGSLAAEQSSGFVMTTARELPPVLRAGDVWRALGAPEL